jgi:DNA-directed RNA polymerase subunit M/transcription elongation factor TFIIS
MDNDFNGYQKLQQRYAEMSDNKLLEMAESLDDLTDIAQRALNDEISKRGLGAKPGEKEHAPVAVEKRDLRVVREAESVEEAERLVDILEASGMRALISDQKIEYVDGTSEIKPAVMVYYLDLGRADEILRSALPGKEEDSASDSEPQYAVCPQCQSPDIIFEGIESQSGNGTESKYNWSCDACGHRWSDDGLQQSSGAQGS